MEDNDKISGSDGEETVPETGAVENQPKKRGPGRPPGSRNKVSASARELLATEGIAGIRALCKFAAGKTVYRPIAGGAREKLTPDINQMLAAQRAILDRLVPTLKAQEITGRDGEPLLGNADTPTNSRQVARSILAIIDRASVERGGGADSGARSDISLHPSTENRIAENPAENFSEHTGEPCSGTFTNGAALSSNLAGASVSSPDGEAPAISINGNAAPAVGTVERIGDQGHSIVFQGNARDGRQKFAICDQYGRPCSAAWGRDEAERMCRQLIEEGHISR